MIRVLAVPGKSIKNVVGQMHSLCIRQMRAFV